MRTAFITELDQLASESLGVGIAGRHRKTAGVFGALAAHFGGNAYIRNSLDTGRWSKDLGSDFYGAATGQKRGFLGGVRAGLQGIVLPEKTILREKAHDAGAWLRDNLAKQMPSVTPDHIRQSMMGLHNDSGNQRDPVYRKLRFLYHKYKGETGLGNTVARAVTEGVAPARSGGWRSWGSYGAGKITGAGAGFAAGSAVDPITTGYNGTKLLTADSNFRRAAPPGVVGALDHGLFKSHVNRYIRAAENNKPVGKWYNRFVNYGLNPITHDVGVAAASTVPIRRDIQNVAGLFHNTPPVTQRVPFHRPQPIAV